MCTGGQLVVLKNLSLSLAKDTSYIEKISLILRSLQHQSWQFEQLRYAAIRFAVIRSARRSLEPNNLVCNVIPDMSVQINNELLDHVWDRV